MSDDITNLPVPIEDDAEWAEVLDDDFYFPEEETHPIITGHYYQSLVGYNDLPEGEYVFVVSFDDEKVWVQYRNKYKLSFAIDEFLAHFEHRHEAGLRARQEEMARITSESEKDKQQYARLAAKMRNEDPYALLTSAPSKEQIKDVTGTALVHNTPEQARIRIRNFRNESLKFERRTEKRVAEMTALVKEEQDRISLALKEQQNSITSAVEGLKGLLKKAEEAISTIELYLGRREEIVQIREGDPAPAEDKICLRQLVLYMDEECAVAAEEGGIDFSEIKQFDEWVAQPEHLKQLLPESKGIVALKVRRTNKKYATSEDYAELVREAALNEMNKETYFLFRNGENLYRIHTSFQIADRLFPHLEEFQEFLWTRRYNMVTNKEERVRIEPGTPEYAKAMEKAEARQKHYMSLFLFFQGILDRTEVFDPKPVPKINLLDVEKQDRYVQFIYDAEPGRLLGTERPHFRVWLEDMLSKLDRGQRVIGAWNTYGSGLRNPDMKKERIYPPNAVLPRSMEIYTVERREDEDTVVFLYERDEEVWSEYGGRFGRGGYKRPEKRASCRVHKTDDFFLNIDAATEDDLRYYLNSRISRSSYVKMIPLLKTALAMKEQERKDEEPFRLLLIGEIIREYGAEMGEVEKVIDELISWWKFKNFIHRALLSDDTQAVKMIVHEYGLRRSRSALVEKYDTDALLFYIREAHPGVLVITHKMENQFVAYVPEARSPFVRVQQWKIARGDVSFVDEKRHQVVGKEYMRFREVLFESEAWAEWPKDLRISEWVSDGDLEAVEAEVWTKLYEVFEKREKGEDFPFHPIALTFRERDQEIKAYLVTEEPSAPEHDKVLTGQFRRLSEITLRKQRVQWEKKRDVFTFETPYWEGSDNLWGGKFEVGHNERVLWLDETAIEYLHKIEASFADKIERRDYLLKVRGAYLKQVEAEYERLFLAHRFLVFMDEYGDLELWEHEKGKIRIPRLETAAVRDALSYLLEKGVNVAGWTVAKVLKEAEQYGFALERQGRWGMEKYVTDDLPMDYELQPEES